MIRDDDVLQ